MRLAIVSAHYPPNFTSGGTLIPQRIADGFAGRGDEVFVFAGALDPAEDDMWSWRESTATGVEITWTVINSVIDWAAEENYRNPRIDAAFAAFLLRVRPDVVHVHSLQGLGAGPVSLAKAHGAAVVLTMHDMWWWCSRQFLAEKNMRPCSPVVSCGICPCEKDNDWLVKRDRLLAAHLQNVDLVLAPSTTMMALLQANGVDPDRLALDENPAATAANGPIRTPQQRPLARSGGADADGLPVRFVYAGGPHPLKGAAVAMAAAGLLAETAGWTLDVYGMTLPESSPAAPVPDQIAARPPYPAHQVAEVLSGYDVMLMPSVATESYSLITREALDVGVPVITGDNPGPLEVVQDGVNGLVVARGDADALAEAMRSLIQDRDLLRRLSPTPGGIRLRTLAEQLDGLTERYRSLTSGYRAADSRAERDADGRAVGTAGAVDGRAAGDAAPIRRVLLLTGIDRAPLRYRGRLPQESLADLGVRMDIRHYRDVEAPSLARTAEAVVLYRVPATEQILDLIDMVRSRAEPVPVLFDIDDLIFDPDVEPELREVLAPLSDVDRDLYWRGVRRYRTTLEAADGYIGSTAMLCEAVDELLGIPSYRFANGVGRQLARVSDSELRRARADGPPRIGYLSGTNTHNEDWAFIEPAVLQVMQEFPDVELWLGGLLETSPALEQVADRIVRLPLLQWHRLPAVLRDLDVNLAPLAPGSRFNEAKSSIKWLEAALVETPTVASPTEPFRTDIEHRATGMLADAVDDWVDALRWLLANPAQTRRIGHAARSSALLRYPPNLQGRRYLEILSTARRGVAEHGHREIFTEWEPVFDSEPFIPVAAEPYGVIDIAGTDRAPAPAARKTRRLVNDYRINAVNHLRTEGAVRTFRKAAEVTIRLPHKALRRIR